VGHRRENGSRSPQNRKQEILYNLVGNNVVLFQIWPSPLFLWVSFISFSFFLSFFLLPILAERVALDLQCRLQRNTRFTIFKRGPSPPSEGAVTHTLGPPPRGMWYLSVVCFYYATRVAIVSSATYEWCGSSLTSFLVIHSRYNIARYRHISGAIPSPLYTFLVSWTTSQWSRALLFGEYFAALSVSVGLCSI
jgi:hypothetical protein